MASDTNIWKQYLAAARQELERATGTGRPAGGRMNPLGIRNVLDAGGQTSNSPSGSGVRTQWGVAPTDADVMRVALQMSGGWKPGNGPAPGTTAPQRGRGFGNDVGYAGQASAPSALQQLAAEFQRRMDEANAANIARYDESKGELTTLRDRNRERVTNWGNAALADINDRMKESQGNISADLAARGLGNSTITGALQQRVARDAARESQRVTEMRDDRASQYDTRDTGNLVNLIGSRTDAAPDYALLVNLADRIGQADALKAFAEQRQQGGGYQPLPYQGVPNYGSPGGAYMAAPAYVNMFAGAMNSQPFGFTSRPGIVSNRYPQVSQRPPQQRYDAQRTADYAATLPYVAPTPNPFAGPNSSAGPAQLWGPVAQPVINPSDLQQMFYG